MIKRVCINCGSNFGSADIYRREVNLLAKYLVKNSISIVYGGSDEGLMGEIARGVLSGGGSVTGVIPEYLHTKAKKLDVTELFVVQSMHERKQKMFDLSDAFIALPGGFGTLDEIFEMLTWGQLGLHDKPCALFNINNYYDHLLEFLDHATKERFIKIEHRNSLIVDNDVESLFVKLYSFKPVHLGKRM